MTTPKKDAPKPAQDIESAFQLLMTACRRHSMAVKDHEADPTIAKKERMFAEEGALRLAEGAVYQAVVANM